jgi:hypothetical protein
VIGTSIQAFVRQLKIATGNRDGIRRLHYLRLDELVHGELRHRRRGCIPVPEHLSYRGTSSLPARFRAYRDPKYWRRERIAGRRYFRRCNATL